MEIKFVMSKAFAEKYGGIEAAMYQTMMLSILKKHPVDMFVFAHRDGITTIRCAGYHLWGSQLGVLDETTIVAHFESLPIETFWVKFDVYPTFILGTFIFPEDY